MCVYIFRMCVYMCIYVYICVYIYRIHVHIFTEEVWVPAVTRTRRVDLVAAEVRLAIEESLNLFICMRVCVQCVCS